MSTLALILVIGEAALAVAAILIAWHFAAELDRLKGGQPARARLTTLVRSAPPFQHHSGRHQSRRGTVPISLLGAEDTAAHADAMHEASEPFLPSLPEHHWALYMTPEEWQSHVNAGRAVEPEKADGHPPWTGSQPALTPEVEEAERRRIEYARMSIENAPRVTPELMHEVLAGLRALPAAPAYGTDRCEADVLAAERQDAGLLT